MATSKKIVTLQKQLTKLALEVAKNMNIELNFSNESIKSVEIILDELHKDYKKTRDKEGLKGLALEFGAYIITVIEHNFEKGEWKRNHPDFEENSYPYYWRDETIFPYNWCLKRIIDGKGDDIWLKYQVFVLGKETDKK